MLSKWMKIIMLIRLISSIHKDHHNHLDIQLYSKYSLTIPVESVLLKVDPRSTRRDTYTLYQERKAEVLQKN